MKVGKMNKWQEGRTLKKLQAGDEESFGKIYDLYVDRIYKYVFFKIGSKEKVEEIVQDVFLKFWRFAKDKENEVKNVSALLYSICRSMVADYYRAESGGEEVISFEETIMSETELGSEENLSDDIDINLDLEKVKSALAELSPIYQDVIIMKYMEELSNKEIGEVLGKEEGNIRVLAYRAMKQLRLIFKSDG